MGKSYVDPDSLSKKFDEVSADLKVGSVSKLKDLVTTLRSVVKASKEPTCEAMSQVLESFYKVVVNSGRALAMYQLVRATEIGQM
jgi:predicted dinucleotide-utilizing enzyme